MNFAAFQVWREECLQSRPGVLDCGETNLYRALASLQPQPGECAPDRRIHRCDLARLWLRRYGFPESDTRRALVSRGVRHSLALLFAELARIGASLWIPGDVYPVYGELARAAGLTPGEFPTLPEPQLPRNTVTHRTEYLLLANPWKPLGRFLSVGELAGLIEWLNASPIRHLLVDCVYDLGVPFHFTTRELLNTGRVMLLHSVTKGWLCPKTFGVALLDEANPGLEAAFRNAPPSPQQLALAEELLLTGAGLPARVAAELDSRRRSFLATLPPKVANLLLIDPANQSPADYFFPVREVVEELLTTHNVIGIPAGAFGGTWSGSILTSLAFGSGASPGGRA